MTVNFTKLDRGKNVSHSNNWIQFTALFSPFIHCKSANIGKSTAEDIFQERRNFFAMPRYIFFAKVKSLIQLKVCFFHKIKKLTEFFHFLKPGQTFNGPFHRLF